MNRTAYRLLLLTSCASGLVLAGAGAQDGASGGDAAGVGGSDVAEGVYLADSTAAVVHDGQTRPLTVAVSGSGARYVGEAFEWWTEGSGPGSEGTVFRHNDDGTSGDLVETCERA